MKKALYLLLVLLLSVSVFGCIKGNSENDPAKVVPQQGEQQEKDTIVYQNTKYGFSFSLPQTWQGYTIVSEEWEGYSLVDGAPSSSPAETGVIMNIRHPQWNSQNQRQDIPIMVLTLDQWQSLQREEFHIGAAPMNPSELGRNTEYVFALPARYNYAFLPGYEEVEDIIKSSPLQALAR